jgi:uncharacterized protein YndB with AHSA1/START domain
MEPIRRSLKVRAPVETAFRVFTEGMGTWWPLGTHSISVDQELDQKAVDVKVDAREGGRLEEVLDDGSTRDWGEIVAWDPPRRVTIAWKPNDRPTPPTEIDVSFTSDGETTQVELEHRGWERLGQVADQVRPLYASEGGWTMTLDLYRRKAEGSTPG